MYSKSYGHSGTEYYLSLGFPQSFVPKISECTINADGILFVILKTKHIKDTIIYQGCWFEKSRGFEVKKVNGYLIKSGELFAHGITLEKANRDLKRKLNPIIDRLKSLTPDTVITKTDYHKLTGACMVGINKFLADHEITISRMKASDVLELVKKHNGYGWQKLEALLIKMLIVA